MSTSIFFGGVFIKQADLAHIGGIGNGIFAYSEIYIRLSRLRTLKLALNPIDFSVLDKIRARLVKAKRNVFLNALPPDIQNPVVIARTRVITRFAADRNLLDALVQIRGNVDFFEKRRDNNGFVLYGKRSENRKPKVRSVLIFDRAADKNVVIAVAPIIGKPLREPVDTLREEVEQAVRAFFYHLPAIRAPIVRVAKQEIRSKAGENNLPRRDFIASVAFSLYGEIKVRGFAAKAACGRASVHFVLPINIAVFAAGTDFRAAVPRVPVCV